VRPSVTGRSGPVVRPISTHLSRRKAHPPQAHWLKSLAIAKKPVRDRNAAQPLRVDNQALVDAQLRVAVNEVYSMGLVKDEQDMDGGRGLTRSNP
jgi:hypothetical protein